MPVSTPHPQYQAHKAKTTLTRAASNGLDSSNSSDYIMQRLAESDSDYARRVQKAIYTNYTGRTREGFSGAVFRVDPKVEYPSQSEHLLDDFDGAGTSTVSASKMIFDDVMETGRIGLLAEYPVTGGTKTKAEVDANGIRSHVAIYSSESIINYKFIVKNGKKLLSLVVLQEEKPENTNDAFSHSTKTVYRVLALIGGVYTQCVYDQDGIKIEQDSIPKVQGNKSLSYIPFFFVGSKDNLPDFDNPVLYDIAIVNIGHFRNSADHENNLSIHAGATLVVFSEMDQTQFEERNPSGLVIGENNGLLLSQEDKAELLQINSASAVSAEMEKKETRMMQIGAKIIQKRGTGDETAEAARIHASSENSVLDTVVGNISEGMTQVAQVCALFDGGDPEKVEIQLNKDFWMMKISSQDAMAYIQLNDIGVLRKKSLVRLLQDAEIEDKDLTVDEILDEASQESPI